MGIHRLFKLVTARVFRLHAVKRLTIKRVGFPAHGEAHARRRQQIALVGGVDEHLSLIDIAVERGDCGDAAVIPGDTLLAFEPLVAVHGDPVFLDPVFEDRFRHVRFEDPHRAFRAVDGGIALSAVAILPGFLPLPRLRFLIGQPHPVIEIARQAADDRLVAGIRPAEAAGAEAAEMPFRSHHHHGPAHAFGLHGRDNSGGGAAVHHDVNRNRGGGRTNRTGDGEQDRETLHGSENTRRVGCSFRRPETGRAGQPGLRKR